MRGARKREILRFWIAGAKLTALEDMDAEYIRDHSLRSFLAFCRGVWLMLMMSIKG